MVGSAVEKYRSRSYAVFNVVNISLLSLLAVVMLFPYLNVLAKAFNDGEDVMRGGITVYPRMPTLSNFKTILSNSGVQRSFLISLLRVVVGTSFGLTIQYFAAYALSSKRLAGRSAIIIFLLIPLYFNGGLIPTYLLYARIGLLNNFLVYVLPTAFNLYNVVIIRAYLYSIPVELKESAKLDGAGDLRVLFKIVAPLSKPVIATMVLWIAVYHWNDWVTTLYFVTNRALFPLQYILMQMLKEAERIQKLIEESIRLGVGTVRMKRPTTESLQAAQTVITIFPIVLLYPILQRHFIHGVILGAIKD